MILLIVIIQLLILILILVLLSPAPSLVLRFERYAARDGDSRLIAASDVGELFADCGHAVPSAAELQALLNRYPSHDDRDESAGAVVQIGFEAFLQMAKHLEDEQQRRQGETTFFGKIYQQFVSSNNLAAMAADSS